MRYSTKENSAFTLIEMLIVLAILAVLVALLFPVFVRVREKGRAANCTNNLQQLSLAFQQYIADNNSFPLWYNEHRPANPLPNAYPGVPWAIRIQPYLKSTAVFQCPSEDHDANLNPMFLGGLGTNGFSDYSYNTWLSGMLDSKVIKTSEVATIFDCGNGPGYNSQTSPAGPGEGGGSGDRHSGGANYAFVDGHIKWFKVEDPRVWFNFYFNEAHETKNGKPVW